MPDFSQGEWDDAKKAQALVEAVAALFTCEGHSVLCWDTIPYPLGLRVMASTCEMEQ